MPSSCQVLKYYPLQSQKWIPGEKNCLFFCAATAITFKWHFSCTIQWSHLYSSYCSIVGQLKNKTQEQKNTAGFSYISCLVEPVAFLPCAIYNNVIWWIHLDYLSCLDLVHDVSWARRRKNVHKSMVDWITLPRGSIAEYWALWRTQRQKHRSNLPVGHHIMSDMLSTCQELSNDVWHAHIGKISIIVYSILLFVYVCGHFSKRTPTIFFFLTIPDLWHLGDSKMVCHVHVTRLDPYFWFLGLKTNCVWFSTT